MKRIVTVVIVLIGFFLLSFYQFFKLYDAKFHLVFCNVGQGDGIFIRTPKGLDILVDGGPDDSILACLSKHMPFWDRDLELVILTHPHQDHFMGLFSVLKNYKVTSFATENLQNKTVGFAKLMELLKTQSVPTRFVFAGDKFLLKDGVYFEIVGPTKEFLKETSPEGFIGESGEFGSVETLIKYKDFSALLTGDSQASELGEILKQVQNDKELSVLQVPHHGSKTGLTSEILDALKPKAAVISVGKNSYGHPTPFTLQLLKDKGIKTLRTDQDGDVEIVSDGVVFTVVK